MPDYLGFFKDLKITFSKHCRSGLLPAGTCQCWRCRKSRGEEATEETELIAEAEAAVADASFKSQMKKYMKDQGIG
jgi:hypothetical protein